MKSQNLLKISVIISILLLYTYVILLFFTDTDNSLKLLHDENELNICLKNIHPMNVYVDLRDREDYESGHIKGFINIASKDGSELLEYLSEKDYNINIYI